MRRWQRVAAPVVVALAALSIVVAGSAQTTQEFKAHFQDFDVCAPGIDECGHGHIQGFGTVTSALVFTSFAPGPGPDCVTGTADRFVRLDRDGSTLLLAIAGTICEQKIEGTFAIVGGSGVFSGASGEGTLWGVAIRGVPGGSVQFRGTITLP